MRVELFVSALFVGFVRSQEKLTQNPCALKQTCHECIQTPTCVWCSQPNFDDSKRCVQPTDDWKCDPQYIYNPDNEYTILQAKQLTRISKSGSESSSSSGSSYSSASKTSSSSSSSSSTWTSSSSGVSVATSSSASDIVQISPQAVNLKLRMNEAHRIYVDYSQAVAYPVDLYYLMDLSKSMADDKEKLSSLGNLLAESMKNITSNFRLGFGSFVDKVVMPYVSVIPRNLEEPCTGCKAPYGYTNVMSLSTDTDRFAVEVQNASVSGNLDAPEGGFDAIMQAVVCRDQIGWREKARRLLVFSTDDGFHYAGDGKLGGIVKPNDGQCHLDEHGMYTHSTIQDYPSVFQLNSKVKQNSINIIFAVTNEHYNLYERLSRHIEGSYAGILSEDSSNVVELVKDQYNKITSSVEMKDTASSAIKVTYYSDCNDPKGQLVATNKCDGLKVDSQIRFQVEVVAKSCPANKKDWKQKFQIYPVGLNESLTINLELLCDCPCENLGHPEYVIKASSCKGFGTLKCGVCECDETHFGRNCECDAQNIEQDESGVRCRPDNTTTIECSGRGHCVCGQCQCEDRLNPLEKISGPFCECDNFTCDRVDGVLCSGVEHGICACGKCECNPAWSGPDCSCSTRQDTCQPPGGGEICSGKGVCKCGKCECNTEKEGRYSGRFCEKCPTCPGRCTELKDCVQCQVYHKGVLSDEECAKNCTHFTPAVNDTLEVDESKDENLCQYFDEDDCKYTFVYTYDEKGKLVVTAKRDRDCPQPVYVLGIVMGVIGAIVLIGLALLLVWKLCTTIHDRREFARFEKERMMAKWETGENPIFKQATSSFKNPTYAGK